MLNYFKNGAKLSCRSQAGPTTCQTWSSPISSERYAHNHTWPALTWLSCLYVTWQVVVHVTVGAFTRSIDFRCWFHSRRRSTTTTTSSAPTDTTSSTTWTTTTCNTLSSPTPGTRKQQCYVINAVNDVNDMMMRMRMMYLIHIWSLIFNICAWLLYSKKLFTFTFTFRAFGRRFIHIYRLPKSTFVEGETAIYIAVVHKDRNRHTHTHISLHLSASL